MSPSLASQDATVATGAAAMMAIRVLLDHEVPEENINMVSLLMAESGKTSSTLLTYKYDHMQESTALPMPFPMSRSSPQQLTRRSTTSSMFCQELEILETGWPEFVV